MQYSYKKKKKKQKERIHKYKSLKKMNHVNYTVKV